MLNNIKKRTKDQKGFTIIEVLIVLAIAGLILLIVFLAVPALQRNSRNTTLKSDVQAVAGGISEYSSNNAGAIPAAAAGSITGSGSSLVIGSAGATASVKVNGSTTVTAITAAPGYAAGAFPKSTIQVWFAHDCTAAASARATAIYFGVENATGTTQQCQDS